MRQREQQQYDDDRDTYRLVFPEKVSFDQVTDSINAVRRALGGGRWQLGQTTMVLELLHTERGIQHRLRLPAKKAEFIINQLQSHIPGLHIEPLESPSYPPWVCVREIGTTKHDARLGISSAEALSKTLLGGSQSLGKGEATILQVVLTSAAPERPPAAKDNTEHQAKLEEPNFLAIIRLGSAAKTKPRANQLIGLLGNAIGSADGNARFRRLLRFGDPVTRLNRAAVPFMWPAQLMLSEVSALGGMPINSPDIPGLTRPPTRHMRADPQIPTRGIIFGRSTVPNNPRPIALTPEDLTTHLLLLGKTGTGKSTVFEQGAAQIMRQKMGLVLLDPHGDLTKSILSLVPRDRVNDVVYIDPMDTEHPVGLNLLQGGSPSSITSYLIGVLESMFGAGPLTGHVLRNTIYTVAQHPGMTLYEVALALDDPAFRDEITRNIEDEQLKRYWTRYENLSRAEQSQSTEPVMRRLGVFLTPEFKGIFGQSKGLDMAKALAQGKIVLVNLAQGKIGEKNSELLGAMVVALLWQAVQTRAHLPAEQRKPYFLLADEFQRYMKLPTSFGDILAEARKYKLSCWMATQSIGQISEVRNDVMVNARNKFIFETGSADATTVAREIGVRPEDISLLPQYTALFSMPHVPTATVLTLPSPQPTGLANEVMAASRSQFGKPREDVELEIAARRKTKIAHKRMRPKIGRED